ncbi:hypothetical protein B566_EDAN011375 [Ephemera danica]|nr:hypothetical protein B566_EDAN011375 [Ephemera danica]
MQPRMCPPPPCDTQLFSKGCITRPALNASFLYVMASGVVQKKQRIVARSQCRNIKNECPKPSCDEPVLLPGRCCKVCPGDLHSPDIVQDIPSPSANEESERNMKGFAALLTGRTSLKELDTRYVATARFTFHKKNLYYSIIQSNDMPRPRALHFLDANRNILKEQLLTESTYRNATGKTCGVWWRVPRAYRQLLRDERVHVALLTDVPGGLTSGAEEPSALGGSVARYKGLNTEMFSSLLEAVPENPSRGAGGTAIITTSSSAPSIHLSIVFNGAFSADDVADVPLNVRLSSDKNLVLDEEVRVHKPSHELNTIEVRSAVKLGDLRLLARGKLQLTVESRNHPQYRLQGDVTTRVACDLFQATLSAADTEDAGGETTDGRAASSATSSVSTTTSGLAWMYLTRDGALVYNVRLDDLDSQLVALSLASGRGRRRQDLVGDLLQSFSSGWANGSLEKLSPRELEQLYAGELSVNVATDERDCLVRGRLTAHSAADPRLADSPLLLKREDTNQPASLVGIAWIAVDHECSLQYEISISGLGNGEQRPLELYLEDLPILVVGAPVSRRKLVEFYGSQLEGFAIGLSDFELARIDSGVAFLDVMDARTNTSLLRARIDKVRVPASCLPRYTDNDLPLMAHDVAPAEQRSCFYESKFFKEGVQWRAERDVCSMCSCQHGRVKCEPIVCPPTPCANPITLPGDCCASCYSAAETNASESNGCNLAGIFYRAGSSWHPYLPPVGFNRCVICSCRSSTLEVSYTPVQCPALTCSDKVAFRPERTSCCKQCPATTPAPSVTTPASSAKHEPTEQQDQTSPRTAQDVIDEGGCIVRKEVYKNGQEWHPHIGSHGQDKCITCRCKMSSMTCTRKSCHRPVCKRKSTVKDDECCQQCHRIRRHRTTAAAAAAAAAHNGHSLGVGS